MSLLSRFFQAVRSCLPVFPGWFSGERSTRSPTSAPSTPSAASTPSPPSTPSTASRKEPGQKPVLSRAERLELLKKAFAQEYFCSGQAPFEVTGSTMMDCGCEPDRHGPLSITEGGQLFYPV